MDAATPLWWIMRDATIWGGIIGLRHNLLKKKWEDMCREGYTSDAVTDEPKIHGVSTSGEDNTTGGKGGRIWGTRGYPYSEERKVGAYLHGDTGVISFWDPLRMCVFEVNVVETDA